MRSRPVIIFLSFYERILGRLRFPLGLAVICCAEILHRVTSFRYLRKCRSEQTSCSEQTYVLPGLEGLDFPVGHSSFGSRIYESVRHGFFRVFLASLISESPWCVNYVLAIRKGVAQVDGKTPRAIRPRQVTISERSDRLRMGAS